MESFAWAFVRGTCATFVLVTAASEKNQGRVVMQCLLLQGVSKGRLWYFSHPWQIWGSVAERPRTGPQPWLDSARDRLCRLDVVLSRKMDVVCLLQYFHTSLHSLALYSPRYTSKGAAVYAIFFKWPEDNVLILPSPDLTASVQVRGLKQRGSLAEIWQGIWKIMMFS